MFGRNLLLAMTMLGLLAVPASAVIMLDVGSGPAMAGWMKVDKWNDYAHAAGTAGSGGTYAGTVDLGAGVTAGFANGYNNTSTDRTAIATSVLHPLGLDDLLRDFTSVGTTAVSMLEIRGLTPGVYSVTLYSADASYLTETNSFTINGGANVIVGPASTSPTLSKVSTTTSVTVDAVGKIIIGRGSVGAGAKLNGVMITPEPVSLLLLLVGAGLTVVRRR
jgi:hypothetical protein